MNAAPTFARQHLAVYAALDDPRRGILDAGKPWGGGADPLAAAVMDDPTWQVLRVDDAQTLWWARLSRSALREVAFHNGNAAAAAELQQGVWTTALDTWSGLPQRAAQPPAWIVHTAYCGSTLLGKMVGALPDVLCLREPALLHLLREPAADRCDLAAVMNLLCRRGPGDAHVVLKCTSYATGSILRAPAGWGGGPVLALTAQLADHVVAHVQHWRGEAMQRQRASANVKRIAGPDAVRSFDGATDAQWCAGQWLFMVAEMRRLALAGAAVTVVDMRRLLLDLPGALRTARDALGLPCADAAVDEVAAQGKWRRHAKRPEVQLDGNERVRRLDHGAAALASELADALRFADGLCDRYPELAAARGWHGA